MGHEVSGPSRSACRQLQCPASKIILPERGTLSTKHNLCVAGSAGRSERAPSRFLGRQAVGRCYDKPSSSLQEVYPKQGRLSSESEVS